MEYMTRSEMIAFIRSHPYVHITHWLFADNEYIYLGRDGNAYDESGYLFENWDPSQLDGANGIRLRVGPEWRNGWRIKEDTCGKEKCDSNP